MKKLLQAIALVPVAAVLFIAVASAAAPDWLARQATGQRTDLTDTRHYEGLLAREELRRQAVTDMLEGQGSEEAAAGLFRMISSNKLPDDEAYNRVAAMAADAAPGKVKVVHNPKNGTSSTDWAR